MSESGPYDDRLRIETPEGVTVELVLAGLGSRFIARLLDSLIQFAFILAWALLLWATGARAIVAAVTTVGIFLGWFAYDIAFEVFASGRTPGKRRTGLRVVTASGGPVGVGASAVRNLLRLIDFLPGGYTVGAVTMLVTRRNQRIGDLAAGTVVVRERRADPVSLGDLTAPVSGPARRSDVGAWDVSSITADEVAAVRRFLERRWSLDPAARSRLAEDLAARLRPKVAGAAGAAPRQGPEAFLEDLVAAKTARS